MPVGNPNWVPGRSGNPKALLPQHDGTTLIVADNMERVLADIDADHGDCALQLLGHGVLLVFGRPFPSILLLVGQEHGRTPGVSRRRLYTALLRSRAQKLFVALPA